MAVGTETRTDSQIQADVLAELKFEPRAQPNEVGVVANPVPPAIRSARCGDRPAFLRGAWDLFSP
jgi:hypothetical protein